MTESKSAVGTNSAAGSQVTGSAAHTAATRIANENAKTTRPRSSAKKSGWLSRKIDNLLS